MIQHYIGPVANEERRWKGVLSFFFFLHMQLITMSFYDAFEKSILTFEPSGVYFVRVKLYHKACILAFPATYIPSYISLRFLPDFSNSAYLFVKGSWLYRIFLPFNGTVTQDE
jgi:hypothetical protein